VGLPSVASAAVPDLRRHLRSEPLRPLARASAQVPGIFSIVIGSFRLLKPLLLIPIHLSRPIFSGKTVAFQGCTHRPDAFRINWYNAGNLKKYGFSPLYFDMDFITSQICFRIAGILG